MAKRIEYAPEEGREKIILDGQEIGWCKEMVSDVPNLKMEVRICYGPAKDNVLNNTMFGFGRTREEAILNAIETAKMYSQRMVLSCDMLAAELGGL